MQDIRVLEVEGNQVRMRIGNIIAVIGPRKGTREMRVITSYKESAQSGGERPYIPDALYQSAISQAAAILNSRKRRREVQRRK